MTNQEAFTTAVTAIVAQGRPSMSQVGCRYRGPGNTKCAIGHLIPDEQYHPEMETSRLDEIIGLGAVALIGLDAEILCGLQGAHDDTSESSDFVAAFKSSAMKVATRYNLTFPTF